MQTEIAVLSAAALSIGFIHTLTGPDHYLPFIVMARARQWTLLKTTLITFLCGLGHILSSVVIGFIGIAFGIAVGKLEVFESVRGGIAGWALIAFGFAYCIWGIRKAVKGKSHSHSHVHADRIPHAHDHTHADEHSHVHDQKTSKSITPWVLFTIFVLGPCEPLIPILMYPAAKGNMLGVIMVTSVFGIVTLGTMMGLVIVSLLGFKRFSFGPLERYAHAIAGATICLSGLGIQVLGL